MRINELSLKAHKTAVNKGFYDRKREIPELLMLIVTELGEACQEDRKGNTDKFKEEIADVYIRLGDMCGHLDINIEDEIIRKMEINKNRPYRHNKKY